MRNERMRPSTEEPVFGSMTRLRFHTTSSALKPRPLCHFTSRRRCRVQDFKSSDASHFSPRDARVMLSTPVTVRESRCCRAELEDSIQLYVCGLLRSWQRIPSFNVPPF